MDNSIDQQFVEFVVKSLVSNPDAVVVDRRIDEKGVLLELTVDPEDLGRVIGKRGATAQSLRTLLRALGTKNDARYNLKIIDNGVPGAGQDASDDNQPSHHRAAAATNDYTAAPVSSPVTSLSEELGIEHDDIVGAEHNNRLTQTRRELADLDDLDV
jgi:predicted RNA-binding protein YlqC (UPF0109 family)